MTLHPQPVDPVPEDTARVARAAFRRGNPYMTMRDAFGGIFTDDTFAPLYPTRGQPAEAPWRLALVTLFQFAEGLADRPAADAVRGRIDWKYALGLALDDPGFDASVLSEFRSRLIAGNVEELLLTTLLTAFRERGFLKARGRQRTDSTHVLASLRVLNRLECVGETLTHALNSLAVAAPEWLRGQVTPDWFERYGARVSNYRLPRADAERDALASAIGTDGFHLLGAIHAPAAPPWLRSVPAIETLRRVWLQQYYGPQAPVRLRTVADLPPGA